MTMITPTTMMIERSARRILLIKYFVIISHSSLIFYIHLQITYRGS